MKAFTTLAFLCLIAGAFAQFQLTEEQIIKAKGHFDHCIKQEKISEQEATKLLNKNLANPSPAMKCFGTCFFERIGILKNGIVQEPVVLEKLSSIVGEEKIKAFLKKCNNVKGSDRCDTGFKLYQCFEKA